MCEQIDALHRQTLAAADRIRSTVRRTPVERSQALEARGTKVFLKLENTQLTGSFKLRGAFNKILSLDQKERERGVVAASTGNHGMAVACASATIGCPALVFAPSNAASSKIDNIRAYGAEVHQQGNDGIVAERLARKAAIVRGLPYVSPYNDPAVIAGQGTLGIEIAEQIEGLEVVYASLGGGGLISGVGSALAGTSPQAEVVACSPAASAVMHHSLEAGEILALESDPTLSDGTAGGVEEGSITFGLCRELISRSLLVSEEEIRQAIRLIVGRHHTLIEGSAGVAVAGFLQDRERVEGKTVAIVLCGANIDLSTLRDVLG